jgi:hypothetical protein
MSEKIKSFIKNVENLVFAELDIEVPFDIIKKEFDEFQSKNTIPLVPYQTHTQNKREYNLDVLGLIDVDSDPRKASIYLGDKQKLPGSRIPKPTDLYTFFPKTIDWIFKNIPGVYRCKISKLAAGKTTVYHSHPDHLPLLDGVLHIPIITNNNVSMHVKRLDNKDKEYSYHFETGKLYWFSAIRDVEHSVVNFGNTDRWHLWINTRIIDTHYRVIGNDILAKSLHKSKNKVYYE